MAISEAIKRKPVYQEALGLMEAKKIKAIKTWKKEKMAAAKVDYAPYVSASMFSTYEAALDQYAAALEFAYPQYKAAASDFEKENILGKLITRERRSLDNSIQVMNSNRGTRTVVRPAPRASAPAAATTASKPNWWKRISLTVAGLGALWFFTHKDNTQPSAPQEGDKTNTRIEERVNTLERRLADGSKGGVVQQGNTYYASRSSSLTTGMRKRVKSGMTYANTPLGDGMYDDQMLALDQQAQIAARQAAVSELNARRAWSETSAVTALREGSYQENQIKVDTARSNKQLLEEISGTGRAIQDVLRQGSGIVKETENAGRTMKGFLKGKWLGK